MAPRRLVACAWPAAWVWLLACVYALAACSSSSPESARPDTGSDLGVPETSNEAGPSPDTTALDASQDLGGDPADATDAAEITVDALDASHVDAPLTEAPITDVVTVDASGPVDVPLDLMTPRPDVPTGDLGPTRGAPRVHILEPAAESTLRVLTPLRFEVSAPDGFYALTLLRDDMVVGVTYARVASLSIDPSLAPAGVHTLTVRLTDSRGATSTDTVRVIFDAPALRVEEVNPDALEYRNGDEVVLDSRWSTAGIDLTADFSSIDSGWTPTGVTVTDEGAGRYTVRYRISARNTRADGAYTVALTGRVRARPDLPLRVPVAVQLANTPRFPFEPEGGSVEERPPVGGPSPAPGGLPRVDMVLGGATISSGAVATLDLRWTARAGVPLRLFQLTAEGFSGHAVLPLAEGSSGRTALRLALPLATSVPVGAVRLQVRSIDAAGAVSPWFPFPLTVEDVGRGGPMMVNLRGRVRFQRRVVATEVPCALLGAAAYNELAWLTVPAQVEILRVSDGRLMATTTTTATGTYAATFASSADTFRARVSAFVGPAASPDLRVVDRASALQVFRSVPFALAGGAATQNIDITGATAGAFAVLRATVRARAGTLAQIGGVLAPLTVQWADGTDTMVGCGSPISCYVNTTRTLFVGGQAADPDQWDEPVLRHEFGHYVMAQRSLDESPGGAHGGVTPSVPTLAWSEGVASFWGSLLSGNSCYYDSSAAGGFVSPIDAAGPPDVALNTTPPDDPTGTLCEGVVSGALWQLSSLAAFSPPLDPMIPIRWSLFTFLPLATRVNAGAAGTDLTDFLHGWLCAESCKVAEARRVVVGQWLFDYRNPDAYSYCPAPYADAAGAPRRCVGASAIALAGSVVRVSLSGASVTRAPLAGDPVGTLSVGTSPRQLTAVRAQGPGPTRAAVTSFADGTLAVVSIVEGSEREIDWDDNVMTTAAGAPMGVSRLDLGAASQPRGVGVSPSGRFAMVALSALDRVAVVDLDRKVVCETFPVPRPVGEPAGASVPDQVLFLPDGTRAYVSLLGTASLPGSSIAIINVRNATDCAVTGNEVAGHLTDLGGSPRPFSLALNPAATQLAVAGFGNDRVMLVDVASGTTLDLYPAESARRFFETSRVPSALAWTAAGDRLYWGTITGRTDTTLTGFGTLRVGTVADGSTSYDVGVRGSVYSMVLSADGAFVYAGDSAGNLSAISTGLFSGANALPLGSRTGGCLDSSSRATACPTTYTIPGGGAGVRSLLRF